jgi:hypothetical protein
MTKTEWISHIESVLGAVGSYDTGKLTVHQPNLRVSYFMVCDSRGQILCEKASLEDLVDFLLQENALEEPVPEPEDPNEVKDRGKEVGKFYVHTTLPDVATIRLNATCELIISRTDEGVGLDVWDWSDRESLGPVFSDYYFDGELTGEE